MKIEFKCDSCGKSYSVNPELAGRQAKCKQCGNSIVVPAQPTTQSASVAGSTHNVPVARPPTAKPASRPNPPDKNKIMNSFPGNSDTGIGNVAVPNFDTPVGATMASNPGNLKVNKLRYVSVYPRWFLIWHVLLVLSIAGSAYSYWFIPVAMFFLLAVYLYWSRVKNQFMLGCTNPSQIVSLAPPLIATFTDLTKGVGEYPIIKISEQPIHKLSTGKPAVGQKLATVAFYEDRFEESEHWSTFDPKPVACVTGDQQQIQRVMNSIDKDDWETLERGLAQIREMKPGHYRIVDQEYLRTPGPTNPSQLRQAASAMLSDKRYIHMAGEFSKVESEKMEEAKEYIPAAAINQVWCLIEAMKLSGGCKRGLAFTDTHLFFHFSEIGKGQVPYADIAGGFSSNTGLELILRNGQRVYFDDSNFLSETLAALDVLFDVIGGKTS